MEVNARIKNKAVIRTANVLEKRVYRFKLKRFLNTK